MKQTRLYDRFIREAIKSGKPELVDVARKYQVFEASNVARFFFEVSDKENWDYVKDFPNIVPPFEHTWIECERPDYIVSETYGTRKWQKEIRPDRWALSMLRYELPNSQDHEKNERNAARISADKDVVQFLANIVREKPQDFDKIKWVTKAIVYVEFENREPGTRTESTLLSVLSIMWGVQENGQMVGGDKGGYFQSSAIPWRSNEHTKLMADECTAYIQPCLLALCFLHCRNVEVKVQEPPKHVVKRNRKKHGTNLCRYRTLEIEPMKRVLRHEGQMDSTGVTQAMHICRGHFKHYGAQWGTKPLFGKYEGMWWWESMVRGDVVEGVVGGNYTVKQPKKGAA